MTNNNTSCTPDAAPPANSSVAAKWDRYYSAGPAGTAPFDSAQPSSQLIHYLCTCLRGHTCTLKADLIQCDGSDSSSQCDGTGSSTNDATLSSSISQLAAAAPMVLPDVQDCCSAGAEPVQQQQQQLHHCEQCCAYKPPKGGRVLELGCGTGASARWLAHQGFSVTGLDISAAALQQAAAAAAAEGLPLHNPRWLLQDVFSMVAGSQQEQQQQQQQLQQQEQRHQEQQLQQLPAQQQQQLQQELQPPQQPQHHSEAQYDFIYDCQVYHVLVSDQPTSAAHLPTLLHTLLRPGGCLMILAGNANEPAVGPNTLTAHELLQPLLAAGFELVLLRQSRFDSTRHYSSVLGMRPLAWWVVLRRPA